MKVHYGLAVLCTAASSLSAQGATSPRLTLHHLAMGLDSATYHDIANAPFLREQFAGRADRSSSFDGPRCAGSCYYGKHTYLEFYGPANPPGAKPGEVGLELASERSGGINAIMQRYSALRTPFDTMTWLAQDGNAAHSTLLRWRAGGDESLVGSLSFAVVEYTLAMAKRAKVRDSQPDDDRSRDRFLAERMIPDQLFAEITAATFAVPVEEIVKINRTLAHLGVTVIAEGEGAVVQLPEFTLRLLPAWSKPGVRKLEFSLNREALANPTYRFGPSSRLRFGPGRVAVWEF